MNIWSVQELFYIIKVLDAHYVLNQWDNPNWNKNKKGKLKKKSFFDPCPPGWRVIENDVWTNLKLKNVTTGFIIYCDGIEGSENTDYIPKNA